MVKICCARGRRTVLERLGQPDRCPLRRCLDPPAQAPRFAGRGRLDHLALAEQDRLAGVPLSPQAGSSRGEGSRPCSGRPAPAGGRGRGHRSPAGRKSCDESRCHLRPRHRAGLDCETPRRTLPGPGHAAPGQGGDVETAPSAPRRRARRRSQGRSPHAVLDALAQLKSANALGCPGPNPWSRSPIGWLTTASTALGRGVQSLGRHSF